MKSEPILCEVCRLRKAMVAILDGSRVWHVCKECREVKA